MFFEERVREREREWESEWVREWVCEWESERMSVWVCEEMSEGESESEREVTLSYVWLSLNGYVKIILGILSLLKNSFAFEMT
jgi:hypothetical protein